MSQEENIEVARRSFAGWNEGGVQGSGDVGWTDDAELHDPPGLPDAAVHRGADAVAARLEELTDLLPNQLEILDAIAVGEDEVLMITQLHGEGGSSGTPVEQQVSVLMQIADGKVRPWLETRLSFPVGPLFCVINGPTCGRPWSSSQVRIALRRTAVKAGVR